MTPHVEPPEPGVPLALEYATTPNPPRWYNICLTTALALAFFSSVVTYLQIAEWHDHLRGMLALSSAIGVITCHGSAMRPGPMTRPMLFTVLLLGHIAVLFFAVAHPSEPWVGNTLMHHESSYWW